MTRDDILRIAREAGMPSLSLIDIGYLEKFAALVAAAEREACAQLCDIRETTFKGYKTDGLAALCAAAIRARSEE